MRNKYTEQELNDMRQMKEQGATYKQIAEAVGRSVTAVQQKFVEMGWARKLKRVEGEATLADFTPREMIKYLYKLGYRIEDNRLVHVARTVVNMKSILED